MLRCRRRALDEELVRPHAWGVVSSHLIPSMEVERLQAAPPDIQLFHVCCRGQVTHCLFILLWLNGRLAKGQVLLRFQSCEKRAGKQCWR